MKTLSTPLSTLSSSFKSYHGSAENPNKADRAPQVKQLQKFQPILTSAHSYTQNNPAEEQTHRKKKQNKLCFEVN